jgi:hypothetical protein
MVEEEQLKEEKGRRGRSTGLVPAFALFYALGAFGAFKLGCGGFGDGD